MDKIWVPSQAVFGEDPVPPARDNMILTKTLKVNCVGIIVNRQNLYVMFTLKMHKKQLHHYPENYYIYKKEPFDINLFAMAILTRQTFILNIKHFD